MKTIYLILVTLFSMQLLADDMSFTFKSLSNKSGFIAGLAPRNIPDEKGYKGSETTVAPMFTGLRYNYNDFVFQLVIPLIINPDDTKKDVILNTILLDAGYLWEIDNTMLMNGIQFTPGINMGSNQQNDLPSNISLYMLFYKKVVWELSTGLNLQYYHSLSDKVKYNGLYLVRANSGFSIELRIDYYFERERLDVFSDVLLYRDISNGVSNIFLNSGVKFVIDEHNSISVALSIPIYDDKFCDKYGSGLIIYFDKKF